MKVADVYEHNRAGKEWNRLNLREWLLNVFDAPEVLIGRRCTRKIHDHVETCFLNEGWALNVKLAQNAGIKVFAEKDSVAFQLQTGNISRAPYDMLKLQYLYVNGRIIAAALALPTHDAAKKMGENIANARRIVNELKLFDQVITVPILVIAFD